ncbi:MAG TPA: HAMP domain-containing protein, partial [Candidatus Deferrimicrobiaceae bacterium]
MAAVVVMSGGLSAILGTRMNSALREEHANKARALAMNLATNAEEPILIDSRVNLSSLLAASREGDPEIVYAFVLDRQGKIIGHTFKGGFPPELLRRVGGNAGRPGKAVRFLTEEEGPVADFVQPILGGELGLLHLGVSEKQIEERIRETRRYGLFVTGLFLLVGLLLSHALGAYLTRPLKELTAAAREIGEGNLDHRSRVTTRDEIGMLAATFNRMASDLQIYMQARNEAEAALRKAHDELEQRVKERTVQLAAANQELEAFSYSVAHDLRAPLRGIDGFSLALLEEYSGVIDETGKDYLNRIRNGCVRMGALIDDLLKLSRLTRGELHRATLDLSEMAERIATELKEADPGREVEFVIEPGVVVYGDPSLLRAAMTNIFQNAWKFTRKQTHATIEFGSAELDGERTIFIRDNGVGFDMQYVNRLFGSFQRLHSSSEFEGSGIGLAT